MAQFALTTTPIGGGTLSFGPMLLSTCQLTSTKYLMVFKQTSPSHILGQIVDTNGTSAPTVGTTTVINSLVGISFKVERLSATKAILFTQTATTAGTGFATIINISGSTITAGTDVGTPFNATINFAYFLAQEIDTNTLRVAYYTSAEDFFYNDMTVVGDVITAIPNNDNRVSIMAEDEIRASSMIRCDIPGTTDFAFACHSDGKYAIARFQADGTVVSNTFSAVTRTRSMIPIAWDADEWVYVLSSNTFHNYSNDDVTTFFTGGFDTIDGVGQQTLIGAIPLGGEQFMIIGTSDTTPNAGTGNHPRREMRCPNHHHRPGRLSCSRDGFPCPGREGPR